MNEEMKKLKDPEVIIVKKEKEIDKIIGDHVAFSMIAGAIPIPLLDLAAITAIQIDMIRQLSSKYELDFDSELGKSIVSSIFTSYIGTSVGRAGASIVKTIPGIGTILGIGSQVMLAGITTFALGHVFNHHFSQGNTLLTFDIEKIKDMFEELLKKGKEFVNEKEKEMKNNEESIKNQTSIIIRNMSESNIISKEDADKIVDLFKNQKKA